MPTAGKINGSLLILSISTDGGTTWLPVAHATDNSVELTGDTREANTKSSSGWREFLPSFMSWTMSGEHLFAFDATTGFAELLAQFAAQSTIQVKLGSDTTGDKYWTGTGMITALSLNARMEDNASMSYTIQGSGALTEATTT